MPPRKKKDKTSLTSGCASLNHFFKRPRETPREAVGTDNSNKENIITPEATFRSNPQLDNNIVDVAYEALKRRAESGEITATERVLLHDYQRYLHEHRQAALTKGSVEALTKPFRYKYWKDFVYGMPESTAVVGPNRERTPLQETGCLVEDANLVGVETSPQIA